MLGFRIWDSSSKQMVYGIDQGFCILSDGRFTGIWPIRTAPVYVSPGDSYIPMQSTGLKDCNEVEIFEGDIIEFYTDCEDELQFLEVKNVTSFLIEAGEYQACMENDEIGFSEYTTVTGNIYENPKLLEKCDAGI